MPIQIPPDLPAYATLKKEKIRMIDNLFMEIENIRPLRIALVNLMPLKIVTETDFARLLSESPLPIEIDLVRMKTHKSKNTPEEHLMRFYKTPDEVKHIHYDGMIVTGAPVELIDFEDVTYWKELTALFDWAKHSVRSTLYICWAAQAALYHFYKIPKYPLPKKQFGVFPHKINKPSLPLFRGFDDDFYIPHSRHTEVRKEDIEKVAGLDILSESDEAGVYIVASHDGRSFFITGHSEYAPERLDIEYKRDLEKKLPIEMPVNYYREDNPKKGICVKWRAHANLLFTNWLHYYAKNI